MPNLFWYFPTKKSPAKSSLLDFRLVGRGAIMDLSKYFVKDKLIPAIIQDNKTKEVLMLAYMNEESLNKTLKSGYTWFFSRSKNRLWQKGETSGHVQKVVSIFSDCDNDTLLINVEQTGVACHTGAMSCFFNKF